MDTQEITWDQVVQWLADPLYAGLAGGTLLIVGLGFCSIFTRAGFHWSLGLLMLVPGVNLVPFLMLAYCSWPSNRELRSLRKLHGRVQRAEQKFERAA